MRVSLARKRSATAADIEPMATKADAHCQQQQLQQTVAPSQPRALTCSQTNSSGVMATDTIAASDAAMTVDDGDGDSAAAVRSAEPAATATSASIQTAPLALHRCNTTPLVAGAHAATQSARTTSTPSTPRRGRPVAPLILGGGGGGGRGAGGGGGSSWRSEVTARIQRSVTMGTQESMMVMAAAAANSGPNSGSHSVPSLDSPGALPSSPSAGSLTVPLSQPFASATHGSYVQQAAPLQHESPHTPLRLVGGVHSASSLLAARLSHSAAAASAGVPVSGLGLGRGSATTSAHVSPAMGSSRSRSLSQTLGASVGLSLAGAHTNTLGLGLGLGGGGGGGGGGGAAGNLQQQLQQQQMDGSESQGSVPPSLFSFHSTFSGSSALTHGSSASSPLFSASSCATPQQHSSAGIGSAVASGVVPPFSLGGIPLPDFTQMDQVKHASPALRHRARAGHGHSHHPPPSPGAGGRSLIGRSSSSSNIHAHSHAGSFLDSLSTTPPLAALFASAGSYGCGSGSLSGGGGGASAASSTPSTPSRSGFKRRLLEKSDLEKEVKLFSFVSSELLRSCLGLGQGQDHDEGPRVGPEHSYSIVKAQAQAQAQAAAQTQAQAQTQSHTPVGMRSPLFGSAPAPAPPLPAQDPAVGLGMGLPPTPSRIGISGPGGGGGGAGGVAPPPARAARSPGLQPASSSMLFAPLTLPAAQLSAQHQQQQPLSTQPPPSHPATAFSTHFGFSTQLGNSGAAFGMPPLAPGSGSTPITFRSRSSSLASITSASALLPTVPLFAPASATAAAASASSSAASLPAPAASASANSISSCSRFLPFASYNLHGRLGSGSFGDVFHVSVDRDEWNQTQFPAAMLPLPQLQLHLPHANTDAHAPAPTPASAATAAPAGVLHFAVKKSRLAFKSLQARSRTLHQYQLLHTLFTSQDATSSSCENSQPQQAQHRGPRWHPGLVQVHAVWQESPGVLHECMELCPAPRGIAPYMLLPQRQGQVGVGVGGFGRAAQELVSATMEEYFLAFRARADRMASGAPELQIDLSGQGEGEEGAFRTPRVGDGPGPAPAGTPAPVPSPGVRRRLLSGEDDDDDDDDDDMSDGAASPAPIQRTPHPSTDSDDDSHAGAHAVLPQFPLTATPPPSTLAWHSPAASLQHAPRAHSHAHAHENENENEHDRGVHPCEVELCRALEQVGAALSHLHQNSLLHFDCKPGNIFCTSTPGADPAEDGGTVFKLGDYGSLVHVSDYLRGDGGAAPPGGVAFEPEEGDGDFLAPELLNPLPCLRPPRRCSYSMLGGASHSATPGLSLLSGGGGAAGGELSAAGEAEAAAKELARQELAASLAPAIDVYSLGMSAFSVITGQLLRRRLASPLPASVAPTSASAAVTADGMQQDGAHPQAQPQEQGQEGKEGEEDHFARTLFPASRELRTLVSAMLALDPRARIGMGEVVRRARELRTQHQSAMAQAQVQVGARASGDVAPSLLVNATSDSSASGASTAALLSASSSSMPQHPSPSSPSVDMMEGVEHDSNAPAPTPARGPKQHHSPAKRLSISISGDTHPNGGAALACGAGGDGADVASFSSPSAASVASSPISPALAVSVGAGGDAGRAALRSLSGPLSVASGASSFSSTPSSSRACSSTHSTSSSLGGGPSQNLGLGLGLGRRPSASSGGTSGSTSMSCSVASSSPIGQTIASGSSSPPHSGSECSSNATSPPISASVSPMLSFIHSTSELRISAFPPGSGFGPGQTAPWAAGTSTAAGAPGSGSSGASASRSTSFFAPRNVGVGAGASAGASGGGGNGRALLAHLQMLPAAGASARRDSGSAGSSGGNGHSSAHTPLQSHGHSHTPPSLVGGAAPVAKRQSLHVPGTRSGSAASTLHERGAAMAGGRGNGQRSQSLCNPLVSAMGVRSVDAHMAALASSAHSHGGGGRPSHGSGAHVPSVLLMRGDECVDVGQKELESHHMSQPAADGDKSVPS